MVSTKIRDFVYIVNYNFFERHRAQFPKKILKGFQGKRKRYSACSMNNMRRFKCHLDLEDVMNVQLSSYIIY